MTSRWRGEDRALPRMVAGLVLLVVGAWVAWPVLASLTAPSVNDLAGLTPVLLFALCSGVVLVATSWAASSRRGAAAIAPVAAATAATVLVRLLVHPAAQGIEPAFAVPLVAGVALGFVPGFLVGSASALIAALVQGTVADPLVAQTWTWGLWGAAGGLLHRLRTIPAWLGASLLCLPLALLSGLALNASGWTSGTGPGEGAFLPGATPWESAHRLWQYTEATSLGIDTVRAISTVTLTLVLGLPAIRALRQAAGSGPHPPIPADRARTPQIFPDALAHRTRSRAVHSMWKDTDD